MSTPNTPSLEEKLACSVEALRLRTRAHGTVRSRGIKTVGQFAYSGRLRPAFRSDCDRYSGVIATGIPVGLRPPFRSIPTG